MWLHCCPDNKFALRFSIARKKAWARASIRSLAPRAMAQIWMPTGAGGLQIRVQPRQQRRRPMRATARDGRFARKRRCWKRRLQQGACRNTAACLMHIRPLAHPSHQIAKCAPACLLRFRNLFSGQVLADRTQHSVAQIPRRAM